MGDSELDEELRMKQVARVPNTYKRSNTGREATDLVMSHILEGLVEGTYVPGQRLNAKQLTEELDVSIVPVREALHYLAGEGLVELMALKGARIPTMDQDEMVNWWDIYCNISRRAMIDAPAKLAADPNLLAQIDEAMVNIHALVGADNHRRFIMTLLAFHRVLNEICNLKEIDESMRRLQTVYWCSFLPDFVDFDVYGPEFASHYQQVADLIKIGAGAAAFALFEWHVAWSSALIRGEHLEPRRPWLAA